MPAERQEELPCGRWAVTCRGTCMASCDEMILGRVQLPVSGGQQYVGRTAAPRRRVRATVTALPGLPRQTGRTAVPGKPFEILIAAPAMRAFKQQCFRDLGAQRSWLEACARARPFMVPAAARLHSISLEHVHDRAAGYPSVLIVVIAQLDWDLEGLFMV